jgi:cysteine synthase
MPDVFLTHLAAGIGTSGTLTGAGRRLRAFNAGSQIAAVLEPPAS